MTQQRILTGGAAKTAWNRYRAWLGAKDRRVVHSNVVRLHGGMNQAVQDKLQKDRKRLMELRQKQQRQAGFVEDPGRNVGKPHGVYVTDLGERKTNVLLCRSCKHKFNPGKYGYYIDRRFAYCQGRCDACREHETQATLFVHESYLTGPNGYPTQHGLSWIPK